MNGKKLWITLLIAFAFAGMAGSYFLYHKFQLFQRPEKASDSASASNGSLENQDFFTVRIFYPVENRLEPAERNLPRTTRPAAIADAVIEEYFKGPGNGKISYIPQNVKLLGTYKDARQILYVDLSDEFRRNFQGDALSEYLLLKGLFESVISNLQDIQDVKILIEGKEIETLGGHVFLKYPLRNAVGSEFRGDKKI